MCDLINKNKKIILIFLVNSLILWNQSNFIVKVNGEKICDTTEVINNNVEKLNQLKDCEVIHGSITLAKISLENINEYNTSIREITGYLLIYRVENLISLENMFPNLTLIRGEEKFFQYSLIIYENINLLNLGLKNLMRITDGSIRITRNPQLCFVKTINWIEILSNMNKQDYILKMNREEIHCGYCRELDDNEKLSVFNEHFCWKYDEFQKVCRKNDGQYTGSMEKCCADDCLSSCTLDIGQNLTSCSVCSDFKDPKGKCISNCGPSLYKLNNRQCVTADVCKSLKLIPLKDKCIKMCPDGYTQPNNKLECIKCPANICLKTCRGNLTIFTETDAKILKECTKIDGYLEIELKPKNTKIIALLESHLSDIQEITGYLKISKSPQIKTLSFLKNLETVDGKYLFENQYSLYIYDNFNLEVLWDESQKIVFMNGTAFFHLNPKFCIKYISNLVFKNDIDLDIIKAVFNISNGHETFCNRIKILTSVEEVSSIAVRIKIEPFIKRENKNNFLGYIYYYMEAPEKNVSLFDGFHGCGHDNWQMSISLGLNIRYVIKNLKPNTQYAYFVRSFAIMDYPSKLNGLSDVDYFTTKNIDDRPAPLTKLFFNVINTTAIELFWWPPKFPNGTEPLSTNDTSRSYYILLQHTVLANYPTEKSQKNVNTSSCTLESPSKWRGLNPKETDYYAREQFFVDNLIPDFLCRSPVTSLLKKKEGPAPTEFPEDVKLILDYLAYIKKKDMEFQKEQDTGTADFQLPKLYNNSTILKETCCSKACICINGIRSNYLIRSLNPNTWYKITVKVCNKADICSIATYLTAKTMKSVELT